MKRHQRYNLQYHPRQYNLYNLYNYRFYNLYHSLHQGNDVYFECSVKARPAYNRLSWWKDVSNRNYNYNHNHNNHDHDNHNNRLSWLKDVSFSILITIMIFSITISIITLIIMINKLKNKENQFSNI